MLEQTILEVNLALVKLRGYTRRKLAKGVL